MFVFFLLLVTLILRESDCWFKNMNVQSFIYLSLLMTDFKMNSL